MAGGPGQGTAGSASAAVVGSRQYIDRSSSATAVGSGQGASRVASVTWACPNGEPPKKRRKITKSAESSIVPRGDEAPAAAMYFPLSQSLEITTKKKGKHSQTLETTNKKNEKGCKRSGKGKKMELAKKDGSCPVVPFDSPTVGTRSKKTNLASPATSTRSKRRLSL